MIRRTRCLPVGNKRSGSNLPLSTSCSATLRWRQISIYCFWKSGDPKKHSPRLRNGNMLPCIQYFIPSFHAACSRWWCCYFYQLSSTQLLLHVNMAAGVKIPAEAHESQRACHLSFLEYIKCHELWWGMGQVRFINRSNKNIFDV